MHNDFEFSGEKKQEKRLTYRRLQSFLESYYGESISIGTVAQLCAKKHKRRHTSRRYKGVAQLMFRRAWKGYSLKLNPDAHYSRAMYRLLDSVQKLTEGSVFMGRDDQAGLRTNSTYTHKQYGSIANQNTLTTRTDFVGKTPSNLQITSYNFPSTINNSEHCIGVVKASLVHDKTPSQHMADLVMLETQPELKHLFSDKDTEYVRVDGATDEGPSHWEVQFLWTERHLKKKRILTMVTSRCSGDSCYNRVELQNGHLSRGHANLFIPSTLKGEAVDDEGKFLNQVLRLVSLQKRNLFM